ARASNLSDSRLSSSRISRRRIFSNSGPDSFQVCAHRRIVSFSVISSLSRPRRASRPHALIDTRDPDRLYVRDMTISRRRMFQSLALSGGYSAAAAGAEPAITLDVLRSVSAAHGTNLSDERLRILKPVLEHRLPQVRAIRDFEVDDTVAP